MQNWIRQGILALPASGLIAIVASLIPGAWIDRSVDPGGLARASANVALANMIGISQSVEVVGNHVRCRDTSLDRPPLHLSTHNRLVGRHPSTDQWRVDSHQRDHKAS